MEKNLFQGKEKNQDHSEKKKKQIFDYFQIAEKKYYESTKNLKDAREKQIKLGVNEKFLIKESILNEDPETIKEGIKNSALSSIASDIFMGKLSLDGFEQLLKTKFDTGYVNNIIHNIRSNINNNNIDGNNTIDGKLNKLLNKTSIISNIESIRYIINSIEDSFWNEFNPIK